MKQLARIGLTDITLDVAMISVWGIHSDRIKDAVALCAQHGVKLTEDELTELGTYWIEAWQLGKAKNAKCPLCGSLVKHPEDLCECFEKKRVGKYIAYDVPGAIKDIAEQHPADWRNFTAESFICMTCKCVSDIRLGKIASYFNQGRNWQTPRFCTRCGQAHHKQVRGNGQGSPPELPVPDTPEHAESQPGEVNEQK